MENKLRSLYLLQLVDRALDELEQLKGDLPSEKKSLEEEIARLEARRGELEQTLRSSFAARDLADSEIIAYREKAERYKSQQLGVRNNREYDALTHEIDFAAESVSRLEKEMHANEDKGIQAKGEIEAVDAQIKELRSVLEEKLIALAEISKTNEEEELKYRHEREKIIVRLDRSHLDAYDRIRKAKKGRAIVPVKRGACGGCFAKVPPQKILELRQHDRIYHCEHCGRIIVSDEIAESTSLAL